MWKNEHRIQPFDIAQDRKTGDRRKIQIQSNHENTKVRRHERRGVCFLSFVLS